MAGRIYVMTEEGSLEPLTERSFDTEDLLQELIAAHPELLDGEQIRPGDPRRWLLVSREQGIADAPQVIGRTAASDPLPGDGRSPRRTRLTMEQFLDQLPDPSAVHAARQLLAAAEERGAIVSRKQSSLTISVQSPVRSAPLTVAWLFPSMNASWGGLKGFTIGQVNWVELPGEAQARFDELYRQMSSDGLAEEVGNAKAGGSHGWAIDPAVIAQHIDLVKERLGQAIAILRSL